MPSQTNNQGKGCTQNCLALRKSGVPCLAALSSLVCLTLASFALCASLLRTISGRLRRSMHNYFNSSRASPELVSDLDDYPGAVTRKCF